MCIVSIDFCEWYDQFLNQSDDILVVSKQISKLKRCIIGCVNMDDYEVVLQNISNFLYRWSNNTYVGVCKPYDFKMACNKFFVLLYELLIAMKYSGDESMRDFADSALFQGTLYRYLGYSAGNVQSEFVKPVFDNMYVSWSRKEYVLYLESKLSGPITHIRCDVFNDWYGIDLKPFDVGKEFEDEVVFPMIEECVTNVCYRESKC